MSANISNRVVKIENMGDYYDLKYPDFREYYQCGDYILEIYYHGPEQDAYKNFNVYYAHDYAKNPDVKINGERLSKICPLQIIMDWDNGVSRIDVYTSYFKRGTSQEAQHIIEAEECAKVLQDFVHNTYKREILQEQ